MPIRSLIVDDTVVYRKIVSDILTSLPEIEFLGTAPNGAIALKKMSQNSTDLVFLDVHMPEMDGIETLKRIRKDFPSTIVVMMSGISSRHTSDTIEALQCGAIDFIRKPDGPDRDQNFQQLKSDIASVIRLINIRQSKYLYTNTKSNSVQPVTESHKTIDTILKQKIILPSSYGVCAIGVSTGGPEALSKFIPQLPESFPLPILIVQHMPPFFTKSLADSLCRKSKLKVIEGPEGEIIKPGTVYIAPGGKHMIVRSIDGQLCIGHNDSPPENSCRPSVDVLFRSVASYYGDQGVLSVILTGMGNDGCSGVRTLKRKKCFCITQSESSCVVYGMPRAVDEAGLSDISLPLENIPDQMISMISKLK